MRTSIPIVLSLLFLAGCAASSGPSPMEYGAASSQMQQVNVLRFSSLNETERDRLCHDYSHAFGC
jgi:hypothetical protein